MNLQPSGYEPDELPIAPPRDVCGTNIGLILLLRKDNLEFIFISYILKDFSLNEIQPPNSLFVTAISFRLHQNKKKLLFYLPYMKMFVSLHTERSVEIMSCNLLASKGTNYLSV